MKNYKLIILCIVVAITGISCKKYLDDAFANPNKPVAVDPDLVFPSITSIMGRGIMFDSRGLGSYVQYWARTGAGDAWDRHGYTPGNDFGGDIWRSHYFGFGQNLLNVIRDGHTSSRPAYAGAGHAIFAWSWLLLTDYHGDVILKEAFRPEQLTFTYDTQPEVYEHVKNLTDSALLHLNNAKAQSGGTSFATGDRNLYGGDINKWIRFTYAIKAMVYHRNILKSNYNPDSVIFFADRSFSSAADDALVKYPLSNVNEQLNFLGPRRNNFGGLRQTDYVIRLMNGSIFTGAVDPRMKFLFKQAQAGGFRGLEPGRGESVLPAAQRPPNFWGLYSNAAPAGGVDTGARSYFKNNAPFPILTYAQVQFIKAEAAFKKGDKALAFQAYKNGINGSFDHLQLYYTGYVPISATDRAAFLANTSVVPATPDALTLNHIMTQKFLALWPYNPEETWVDLRKYQYNSSVYSGFALPATFYPDNGGKPVQRVRPRYNSEYLWNVEELKRIGGLDADYHTRPLWFSMP